MMTGGSPMTTWKRPDGAFVDDVAMGVAQIWMVCAMVYVMVYVHGNFPEMDDDWRYDMMVG